MYLLLTLLIVRNVLPGTLGLTWDPVATSSDFPQSNGSKRSRIRLDHLITEAINNLKELGGSNKTTLAAYIEDQYWAPPNFKRLLSAKLKYLVTTGLIIKMKRKYRSAPKKLFLATPGGKPRGVPQV